MIVIFENLKLASYFIEIRIFSRAAPRKSSCKSVRRCTLWTWRKWSKSTASRTRNDPSKGRLLTRNVKFFLIIFLYFYLNECTNSLVADQFLNIRHFLKNLKHLFLLKFRISVSKDDERLVLLQSDQVLMEKVVSLIFPIVFIEGESVSWNNLLFCLF